MQTKNCTQLSLSGTGFKGCLVLIRIVISMTHQTEVLRQTRADIFQLKTYNTDDIQGE